MLNFVFDIQNISTWKYFGLKLKSATMTDYLCNSNDVKEQDVCGIFQSGFVYTEGKSA